MIRSEKKNLHFWLKVILKLKIYEGCGRKYENMEVVEGIIIVIKDIILFIIFLCITIFSPVKREAVERSRTGVVDE